ncbi:MAG: 30S ribosomal protein S4 [Nanoarchaeota archaeon]|nr:30S ribosomal protein S4 [Nanoarchaeota archaeon]
MIRKRKLYQRPMKLYQKDRIEEENVLVKRYGLKSKREIWKTLAKINYFRKRAKDLAKSSGEEQEVFFNYLKSLGLEIKSIADILDLQIEDLLKRRLSSVVVSKALATTPKQARQMIAHKKIIVGKNVIDAPSYIVPINLESEIKIKKKNKIKKEEVNAEKEAPVEVSV